MAQIDRNIYAIKKESLDVLGSPEELLLKNTDQVPKAETKEQKTLILEESVILNNGNVQKTFKEKVSEIKNRMVRAIIRWLEKFSCDK